MTDRRPELCVGGIVRNDGKLLLIERATDPGKGLWSLPGGRVERGETMAAAVEREVLEETGLQVVCEDLVGWVERLADDYHFVIFDFAASLHPLSAPPRAGTDAAEVAWVQLDDVVGLPLVAGLADFLSKHNVIPLRN